MRTIQDLRKDEQAVHSLKNRSKVIFVILFILILSSSFKLFQLTIIERDSYTVESEKNRIIEIPIYPSRGLITLEDGTIIAENIVTQGVFIRSKFLESSKDQIEFLKQAEYELYKNSLVNLELGTNLRRYLPHQSLFSHVIGHLGPIDREERLSLSKKEYPADSYIGKVGIEKIYEESLKGSVGKSAIEVDVYGNKLREILGSSPIDFIMRFKESDLKKVDFVHRTFNKFDLIYFLKSLFFNKKIVF